MTINAKATKPNSTLSQKPKYTCHEIVNPKEPYIAATKSRRITIANAITRYILPKPRENHHHTLPWIIYKIFPGSQVKNFSGLYRFTGIRRPPLRQILYTDAIGSPSPVA